MLPKNRGFFVHVTSRMRGQAFLFEEDEKRVFVQKMRAWAEFSGIGILTHCIMSNHFHLMLWVPVVGGLSHEQIVDKLAGVWPEEKLQAWTDTYTEATKAQKARMDGEMIDRMGNLPAFMRVLKHSFSMWYNHRHSCKGTLWDSRYRSVVVEDSPLALLAVCSYIDLNPVRAKLVLSPGDYVWSGCGAAAGGDFRAREGLRMLMRRAVYLHSENHTNGSQAIAGKDHPERGRKQKIPWRKIQADYDAWLYGKEVSHLIKLHSQRMRSFTRGVGVGGESYLRDLVNEFRSCFGPKRKKAGSPIPGDWQGLLSIRQVD